MKQTIPFVCEKSEVYRYLGYDTQKTENWTSVEQLYSGTFRILSQLVTVQGAFRHFPLQHRPQAIFLTRKQGDFPLPGKDLAALLAQSLWVSLLAVTLGPELDAWIDEQMARGQYAAAAMGDAIGSAAAEVAIEQLDHQLQEQASQCGYQTTSRFSPGYGDLPLSFQKEFLEAMQEEQFPLRVTAQFLLIPRKSITALLGWQPKGSSCQDQSKSCSHKCMTCSFLACQYRHIPLNPLGGAS